MYLIYLLSLKIYNDIFLSSFLVINPQRDSVQANSLLKHSGKLSTIMSLLTVSLFVKLS